MKLLRGEGGGNKCEEKGKMSIKFHRLNIQDKHMLNMEQHHHLLASGRDTKRFVSTKWNLKNPVKKK
uniref:Uncharacterized protein n=1 Tax=Romanomermis culicivorax TaxID=13658 RepID=A0A915KQ50_ROMCU